MSRIDTRRQQIEIQMPAKGLNTSVRGPFVDPSYATELTNMRVYQAELRTRPGMREPGTILTDLTGVPNGAGYYEKTDGSAYTILLTEQKFYYYNTVGPTWTDFTSTATLTGTASQPWGSATAEDFFCFSNGVDVPLRWDGSTLTELDGSALGTGGGTDVYPFRHAMALAGRLIIGYTVETGAKSDRVRWCGANALNNWDVTADATAGFNELTDLPGPITGMRALRNVGYVFKRNGVVRMTETGLVDPAFNFQTALEGVGCLEGRTIADINGLFYFLGDDNVYTWDGVSRPTGIGTPIRARLFDELNRSRLRQCFGFHRTEVPEYWLFVVTGTAEAVTDDEYWPTKAYVYNYLEGAWTVANSHALCATEFKTEGTVLSIDDHTEPIDAWVTPIDSAIGGEDQLKSMLGRFRDDQYPGTLTGGNAAYIDDTLVADQDVTYSSAFESADTRFNRSPDSLGRTSVGPLNNATISRVILTLRHWVDSDITVEVSGDSGATWTSLGQQSLTAADDGIKQLSFSARMTAPQVRCRITSDDPFALLRITYEYFARAEYK